MSTTLLSVHAGFCPWAGAQLLRSVKWCRLAILLILLVSLSSCSSARYRYHSNRYSRVPKYHTVVRGETLYRIASRYGVTQKKIALLNGIHNPKTLRVGARLFVGYHNRGGVSGSSRAGNGGYANSGYSSSAASYTGGRLLWPVKGGRIVSGFGKRGRKFHDGIDIAASSGTPVYAAHSGLVAYASNGLSGYGNLVILRDKTGFTTVYAHNRRLLVRVGKVVRKGDKIAEVGSTGRSSGPHLHFEVRMRNRLSQYVAVDPIPFLKKGSPRKYRYRRNESLTPILANARYSR